jgi:hypothetical protein
VIAHYQSKWKNEESIYILRFMWNKVDTTDASYNLWATQLIYGEDNLLGARKLTLDSIIHINIEIRAKIASNILFENPIKLLVEMPARLATPKLELIK